MTVTLSREGELKLGIQEQLLVGEDIGEGARSWEERRLQTFRLVGVG